MPISVRRGDRFAQMGVTIEILDVGLDFLIYRCHAGGINGAPQRCTLAFFQWQFEKGLLAPVETVQ